jgi:hypothetical protein
MRRHVRFRLLAVLLSLLCAIALAAALTSARAEPGIQSALTPVGGAQGAGHVNVSPTGDDHHDTVFIAQGTAEIHDALPDTTYVIQRAVDFTPGDGICTIAPRACYELNVEGGSMRHEYPSCHAQSVSDRRER